MEPSLVKMAYDTFFGRPKQLATQNLKKGDRTEDAALDQGNPDAPTTQNDQCRIRSSNSVETPDVEYAMAADQSKEAAKAATRRHRTTRRAITPIRARSREGFGDDAGNSDKRIRRNKSGGDQKERQAGRQESERDNENSSMLDKLKDAMANMLNKMKSNRRRRSRQSAQEFAEDRTERAGRKKATRRARRIRRDRRTIRRMRMRRAIRTSTGRQEREEAEREREVGRQVAGQE